MVANRFMWNEQDIEWLSDEETTQKHLAGVHDQSAHGHRGSSNPAPAAPGEGDVDFSRIKIKRNDERDYKQVEKADADGGYWIFPGGTVLKVGAHYDSARKLREDNPDAFRNFDEKRNDAEGALRKAGAVRLMQGHGTTSIETENIDRASLRKVQRMVDAGLISLHKSIVWATPNAPEGFGDGFDPGFVSATLSEFMSAKFATVDMDSVGGYSLKEARLKHLGGAHDQSLHGRRAGGGSRPADLSVGDYLTLRDFQRQGVKSDKPVWVREQDMPPIKPGFTRFYHGTDPKKLDSIMQDGLQAGRGLGERYSIMGTTQKPSQFGQVNIVVDVPKGKLRMINDDWAEIDYTIKPSKFTGFFLNPKKFGADEMDFLIETVAEYNAMKAAGKETRTKHLSGVHDQSRHGWRSGKIYIPKKSDNFWVVKSADPNQGKTQRGGNIAGESNYYILPDKTVLGVTRHRRAAEELQKNNPKILGTDRDRAEDILQSQGGVRVWHHDDKTELETASVDSRSLRAIQRMVDSGALKLNAYVRWGTLNTNDNLIATAGEFMGGKFIGTDPDGYLTVKETRLKHHPGGKDHPQGRHGWRFGGLDKVRGSLRGESADERAEYRKRAGMAEPKKVERPKPKPDGDADLLNQLGQNEYAMNDDPKRLRGIYVSERVKIKDDGNAIRKPDIKPDPDDGTPAPASYGQREALAYEVDRALGIGMTPQTTYRSGETASFQAFVDKATPGVNFDRMKIESDGSFGYNLKNPEAFGRMALLDMVMGNKDRNKGNFLITDDNKVVTIDHGLSAYNSGSNANNYFQMAAAHAREFTGWDGGALGRLPLSSQYRDRLKSMLADGSLKKLFESRISDRKDIVFFAKDEIKDAMSRAQMTIDRWDSYFVEP